MMTTITIYSPTGVAVHETPLNKDAKVFRKLGGDYYVELTFSVDKTLALPKGSYILASDPTTSREEKYALKRDASPEPISGVNGYKYVLKFYSRQHDMEACQIKWLAGDSKELSFRVTTSLRGFAQLIADNMNAYLDDENAWSYDGALDDTDMREQSFDGVSCWDAINNIANAFGVEWWIDHGDQLTIRFGKCENEGNETVIREGEIVNRFPAPKRGDDSNYGTRFYIFGGTQNVPKDYRSNNTTSGGTTFHIAEKRIQLCEIYGDGDKVSKTYHPYYDAVEVLKGEIVEKTIILDDIFPKNETTIGAGDILEQYENIIEGEEKQSVYYIKVEKKLTVLSTLGIKFTSGALSGRSFGAEYTTQQGAIYVKVLHTTENSGGASLIAVPNANLAPKAGDKYILTGVELDKDSITEAERELWDKGTALARQYANDTNVYDCPVNPVYCKEQEVNLALGAKVILKGAHFGEGRKSRIQGYEKLLYAPYIATYNIGDNSVYSRTLKIYKELNATVTEAIVAGNKNITPTKGEKGEPGVSISNVEVEYAVIDSNNTFPDNDVAWSKDIPVRGEGQYIWSRTKIYYSEGDPTTSDPACISGEKGETGASIVKVDVEYAISSSAVSPPYSNWSTTAPTWENGKYIWSRTKTTYSIGDPTYSAPACITGGKGATGNTGASGRGIKSIVEEYYLSTSATSLVGGSWSATHPTWVDGKYIWTRSVITFTDGTTSTTEAICVTGGKGQTGETGPEGPTGPAGKDGERGDRGPALRGPQRWADVDAGYKFYSGADGEPYIDVVLYEDYYYLCKTTHTKGTNPPTSSTYWTKSEKFDIIATKLLLSKYAVIENLGVAAVEMKNKDGEVVFEAVNGNVKCETGTFENITVNSGNIGAWEITPKALTSQGDKNGLSPNIRCLSEDGKAEASIGTNARYQNPRAVGYFKNEINYGEETYAVQISAQSTADKNVAIDIQGGCIEGLAMSNMVSGDLSITLSRKCNHVIATRKGGKSIILPKLLYYHDGYIVRITCIDSGYVNVITTDSEVGKDERECKQAIVMSCLNHEGGISINKEGTFSNIATPATMEFVWVRDYPIDSNQQGAWVLCMYSGLKYMQY